ncbi:MAG TPA: cation-transporting P-type ATPase [Pararhizobium sp.]|uniref:cation-transporting P-type ATPase n=1 Tax=Pararhizobium sp. TaxID=1977563 RepID=UPI002B5C6AA0|nr:cation-transporting P-type ATPase [Pararhizobium sp.]HTO33093.1 cation-transporting P-type ATPase [Pararhizobium sp.]
MPQPINTGSTYWAMPAEELLAGLNAGKDGLSSGEAKTRSLTSGSNRISAANETSAMAAFARQFRSPLILILIFAAIVSSVVGEGSEAVIIGIIVLASCVLSFTQEYGASRAMQALTARIAPKVMVLRDG